MKKATKKPDNKVQMKARGLLINFERIGIDFKLKYSISNKRF
jgi:hypothetical protein